jgi:hypothetical protein
MKKVVLKLIPYVASIVTGFLLFTWGLSSNESWKALLINIASAFLAVPLLYLFYELVRDASHKKLNKELLDYAKMQVDRQVLSMLNHLSKMIYKYEEKDFSFAGINKLLSLKQSEVSARIRNNDYLGFQILKDWELNEEAFHDILKNPFILGRLNDEQIISIVALSKGLLSYDLVFKKADVIFERADKTMIGYKVVKGEDLNPENAKYKDRFLLLKDVGEGEYKVTDFGDFPKYNQDQLLSVFVVKEITIGYLTTVISKTLSDINKWLTLTGGEFVIDAKMFNIGAPSAPGSA